jgi:hypothetical protein
MIAARSWRPPSCRTISMIFFSQGIQILREVLGKLFLEKIRENFRSGIIPVFSQFRLVLYLKQGMWDELAVHPKARQTVTQQRAAAFDELLIPEFYRTPPRQIFSDDPFGLEAYMIGSDVLVGNQDIAGLRGPHGKVQKYIRLGDPFAGGEGPIGADTL